jgi:acyl-coenzyme A thioesterase PaaI-like protein
MANPSQKEIASQTFKTLRNKKGLIEVYDQYHFSKSCNPPTSPPQPIAVGIIKIGDMLDGPMGYVHGGIVALLMDDMIGFATVPLQPWSVTSELAVQYKAPQPNQQYVVIRVYTDEKKTAAYKRENVTKGNKNKRLFLKATCRSLGSSTIETAPNDQGGDGTLYSTASAIMVQVQSTGRSASSGRWRDGPAKKPCCNQTERKMPDPPFNGIEKPDIVNKSLGSFASQTLMINKPVHHAVAGTLGHKKGLLEVYDLFQFPKRCAPSASLPQPIAIGIIKVGNLLDGPPGYVHGGIVALLMDDIMSFATVPLQPWSMTRDLVVQFKAPQPHQHYVVIQVYIDEEKTTADKDGNANEKEGASEMRDTSNATKGNKKKRFFLKATCRSLGSSTLETAPYDRGDDGALYSTATATMVQVQSTGRPASAAPGRDGRQNDRPQVRACL